MWEKSLSGVLLLSFSLSLCIVFSCYLYVFSLFLSHSIVCLTCTNLCAHTQAEKELETFYSFILPGIRERLEEVEAINEEDVL